MGSSPQWSPSGRSSRSTRLSRIRCRTPTSLRAAGPTSSTRYWASSPPCRGARRPRASERRVARGSELNNPHIGAVLARLKERDGESGRRRCALTARQAAASNGRLPGSRFFRRSLAAVILVAGATWVPSGLAADRTVSLSLPVERMQTVKLSRAFADVAVHWHGNASARLEIALSRDGQAFGKRQRVLLDEV